MPFEYKKVLLIGATSGIGHAMALKMVQNGVKVVAVGRRQEKLDELAKQNSDSIETAVFDITKLKEIPDFAKDMFSKHSDIDCVWVNSGMQRHLNWAKPDEVSLDVFDNELLTNYSAFMHLTKAFLPYLQKQAPKPTAMLYTTSGLALIPAIQCPGYCATKAALHHMILCMREQLKNVNSNVKVIELFPPAVQTELHDDKHQPEFKGKGRQMGMPLDEFTEEAWAGLSSDDNEQIPVQMVKSMMGFNEWEMERQGKFHKMTEMIRKQSS